MTILQGLVVIGLLQLVAVPTLTTPLPQDRDAFANQLTALEDAIEKVPTDELQLIESEADVDDLIKNLMDLTDKSEANKASSLEWVDKGVVKAIDQFKELGDELFDEVNMGDELNNLSDITKVLPTAVPDETDELINDLMNLGDLNKTVSSNNDTTIDSTESTPINASSTASKIAGDDLVKDLMDVQIIEEVVSEVITELVLDTEPVNAGTSVAPGDIDYEVITELTMVTEVVYDIVPNEVNSDELEPTSATAAVTLIDDMQPTSTDASLQQNEGVLPEDLTTIQNSDYQPDSTMIVTEVITELETDTDLLHTKVSGLGDMDGEADDETEMYPTDFPDDEDLAMELWDLKAATDDMVDDDEPTFVFTTPYPSILSSDEPIDLGPDLGVITAQPGLNCAEGRFACADGRQCVLQDTVCDIMFDCTDESDESPNVCNHDRECPTGFTKCSRSPQCINDKDWCDGVYHCYNGADEKYCMSCVGPTGGEKKLMIEDFCDGVQDCDDNYDETSERCNHPCPLGSSKCADGLQCIKDDLFCNGFKNCRDGSDESKDCARSMEECERFEMFSCDGICMIKSALCDGMADCKDGVDERGCSNDIFSCPDGFIRRKQDHACVFQIISSRDP